MAEGTYQDKHGRTVTVTHTTSGYLVRYPDTGETINIRK